ncbi:hydantoinase/oxoprolinase family protein [Pseudonocardia halophobica]|uniref:Methylhydantoinase n=1 Tax=Pseudonocardia halophobica TaxID=29401 RepID=A0A9W6L5J1_9PSEU|nr:hydantoinase/oxoprolinase family protein [Pseudonocardia halophobica]GLL13628.1 methylhydantoinase [Pseudonocardia halophobica]
MGWRLGVDTGGTFTDVCLFDEERRVFAITKVASTPHDPGEAVLAGVRDIIEREGAALSGEPEAGVERIGYFAHGTTVATNALLQGKGARTGVLTTEGFRDLLELGRQRRPKLYDLAAQKGELLAPRHLRKEVTERMRYDGTVAVPLDVEQVRRQVRALRDEGVEAVAVCLLYSYLAPGHEQLIKDVLAEEMPDAFVSISSEVLPEFREYERLSTVTTNSFIGPVMQRYLSKLRLALAELGLPCTPQVTQSNGGMMSFPAAEALPVRTVLSGPSTGVVGAAKVAAQSGIADLITFDMGGTSSDVSLVNDGTPSTAPGMEMDGRPIQAPMVDIHTVGAGGGSIAWIDAGGHLKVGPQSAGADPGPACYGRGNHEPTVTDANVVLGVLNQTHLLAGRMPIDADLSFRAVDRLAARLGMSRTAAAQGIISVVTANMARAIRVISVQRGYDPRDYTLVSFGGAGPLHSARLAAELGMRSTLLPQRPGALSALGMLMTDLRSDYSRTRITRAVPEAASEFDAVFADLRARAEAWFAAEGVADADRALRTVIDMRYVGQNYELPVEVPVGPMDEVALKAARTAFDDLHAKRYGYATADEPVEAVTFRVEATGATPQLEFARSEPVGADPSGALAGVRRLFLPERGDYVDAPVYDRDRLRAGNEIAGPALVEQFDTTTLVLPGEHAHVDPTGSILTTLGSHK